MTDWAAVAAAAAAKHGIDADTFVAQMRAESGLQPGKTSGAGAQGIAQIMPATAKGWGVDPNDPHAALDAAAGAMGKYLKSYKGDWRKALAAYNAGVGAVAKYGGVPPYKETQAYVQKILNGRNPQAARPTSRTAAPSAPSADPMSDPKTAALEFIMKGSAWEGVAASRYKPTTTIAPVAPAGPLVTTGKGVPKRRKGETGQQYLDRVLMAKFGLRHDAGNSQTTGGRHMSGSDHYVDKATDFGDAKNSKAQLQAAEDWAEANAAALGAKPVIYGGDEDANHADHAHFATYRSSRGIKKR
jgi:hypothetical protein